MVAPQADVCIVAKARSCQRPPHLHDLRDGPADELGRSRDLHARGGGRQPLGRRRLQRVGHGRGEEQHLRPAAAVQWVLHLRHWVLSLEHWGLSVEHWGQSVEHICLEGVGATHRGVL